MISLAGQLRGERSLRDSMWYKPLKSTAYGEFSFAIYEAKYFMHDAVEVRNEHVNFTSRAFRHVICKCPSCLLFLLIFPLPPFDLLISYGSNRVHASCVLGEFAQLWRVSLDSSQRLGMTSEVSSCKIRQNQEQCNISEESFQYVPIFFLVFCPT